MSLILKVVVKKGDTLSGRCNVTIKTLTQLDYIEDKCPKHYFNKVENSFRCMEHLTSKERKIPSLLLQVIQLFCLRKKSPREGNSANLS